MIASSRDGDHAHQTQYWCSSCKIWHHGRPYGVIARALAYCQPAIDHYLKLSLIEDDGDPAVVPRRFKLLK